MKGVGVGAGYFSQFHYEAWQRIPEVEMLAVCDCSLAKARQRADAYGIPRVYGAGDYRRMLETEQPDFVDIITPPATHLELCQVAVEVGVDIICQKPLAPSYAESLRLAEVVGPFSGRFMVHENWRWQPWYREMKRLLSEDLPGEFYHFAMQTRLGDGWGKDAYLDRQPFFREYPRLYIFETGVHVLDTLRFLFGEVRSLYARTAQRNPVIKGEDSALIVCDFEEGGTAVVDANRYNECDAEDPRYTFGRIRLDGSRGHLELHEDGSMWLKRLGEPISEHVYPHEKRQFAGDCVHALQRHFVDAVLHEKPFESTIQDYLKTVTLVEQAYVSAAENRVVFGEEHGIDKRC